MSSISFFYFFTIPAHMGFIRMMGTIKYGVYYWKRRVLGTWLNFFFIFMGYLKLTNDIYPKNYISYFLQ